MNPNVERPVEMVRRVIIDMQERNFTTREVFHFVRIMESVMNAVGHHDSVERQGRIQTFTEQLYDEHAARTLRHTVMLGFDPEAAIAEEVAKWKA